MSIKITVMSLDFDSNEPPSTTTFKKPEVNIGREDDNDLVLAAPEVSGYHAKFFVKNGDYSPEPTLFVIDLGSSNGTLIESKPLSPNVEIPMAINERVVIGNYLIKPELMAEEGSESADKDKEEGEEAVASSEEDLVTSYGLSKKTDLFDDDASESAEEISADATEEESTDEDTSSEEEVATADEDAAADIEAPADATAAAPADASAAAEGNVIKISGVVGEDEVVEVNFVAHKLYELKGSVVRKGEPLADVTIDGGALGTAATDSDGTFVFSELIEDAEFSLSASKEGFEFEESTISGSISGDLAIVFEAKKLITIRGKVAHGGEALAGVEIDGGPLGTTTTDGEGYYTFTNVPEGTEFTISAAKPGFKLADS